MSWKEIRIIEEPGISILDEERLKSLDMVQIIDEMLENLLDQKTVVVYKTLGMRALGDSKLFRVQTIVDKEPFNIW